jgi:hypothetical protein
MKLYSYIFLLLASVISFSFATYFAYNHLIVENIIMYDLELKIDNTLGINTDADALRFGKLTPGASVERKIVVKNNASRSLSVSILNSGNAAAFIEVLDTSFVLGQNTEREVKFKAYAPEDAEFGTYAGKTTIIFKRVFFE